MTVGRDTDFIIDT